MRPAPNCALLLEAAGICCAAPTLCIPCARQCLRYAYSVSRGATSLLQAAVCFLPRAHTHTHTHTCVHVRSAHAQRWRSRACAYAWLTLHCACKSKREAHRRHSGRSATDRLDTLDGPTTARALELRRHDLVLIGARPSRPRLRARRQASPHAAARWTQRQLAHGAEADRNVDQGREHDAGGREARHRAGPRPQLGRAPRVGRRPQRLPHDWTCFGAQAGAKAIRKQCHKSAAGARAARTRILRSRGAASTATPRAPAVRLPAALTGSHGAGAFASRSASHALSALHSPRHVHGGSVTR